MKRIVVIGATSAIAEHCMRLWVRQDPCDLVLVGRQREKLERIATDLKVRSAASRIQCLTTRFVDSKEIGAFVDHIVQNGPAIDIVLIAHGSLPDQQACQTNLELCQETLILNGLSPALFSEAFVTHMQKANTGTLAVIGSVAGDRGRKSNYVYGAAKGLIYRYVQGLQHRFANTPIKVIFIKPGPTDTPMTAHLKQQGTRLAPVEEVAQHIVNVIHQGKSATVYVPKKWAWLMMIIRHLPKWIFNKLNI